MSSYRCYFVNSGGHIVGLKDIGDCTENEARHIAITLLNREPRYSGVSVWAGHRRIFAEFIPASGASSGVWPLEVAA
jgi:hypothetical protein